MKLVECLARIDKLLTDDERQQVLEHSKNELCLLHHGLGQNIRNSLNLWHEDGPTFWLGMDIMYSDPRTFAKFPEWNAVMNTEDERFSSSLFHPDQMSLYLLHAYHDYLLEKSRAESRTS